MDLMSSYNGNHAKKIQDDMIEALSELSIESADIRTAEEFFDFSKDMDLSLLDNIKLYQFDGATYRESIDIVYKLFREKQLEYGDRYILFLDAIGANMISCMIAYNLEAEIKRNNVLSSRLSHAYERKYDSRQVKMKIAALLAQSDLHNIISSQQLLTTARNNPVIIFEAGKYYCKSEYANAKLKLYALALAYSDLEEKKKINKLTSEFSSKLDSESIKEMTENILKIAKGNNTGKIFWNFIVPVLFMSMHHDKDIEKFIKDNIKGNEQEFLAGLYKNVPNIYFEHNIDKVVELVDIESSEEFVVEYIKQAVIYAWRKSTNGYKAECMLNKMAEKFPKQFIYVMSLMEKIKDTGSNYSGYIGASTECYCSFYEQMYNIMKKHNPKALIDEDVDFCEGLLKITVMNEAKNSKIAKDEISQYLMGKSDLSVLEPYFDSLSDNIVTGSNGYRYSGINKTIESCIKNIPEFKSRYIAFKSIQCHSFTLSLLKNCYNDDYKALINHLIKEGVPVKYRFMLYDYIFESFYTNSYKESFEDVVLKRMVHFTNRYDEYENTCPNMGIFSRKVYVSYLDETNKDDKNSDSIFSMFTDTSKEVRRRAIDVTAKHKNNEEKVLNLLKAKKLAVREAAVDILAVWGAENYKDVLLEMAENEKSKKLVEKIQTILSVNTGATVSEDEDGKTFSPLSFVEEIHKGGRSRQLSWLYETSSQTYTNVHFNNGSGTSEKYLQAIMLCYSGSYQLGISENANMLAKDLNQDELNKFAYEVFSKWVSKGAESKKKWVLYFSLIHGGYNMQEVILHYIKDWSEASRGAIASEAVRALAMNGSSEALMAVDNIAHKFKHKQVKSAALKALDNAAEELGITTDELGDRIVPDLGFDENMQRIFDYGTRKFKVYLTPALEIEVFDENDKKLKSIPSPAKKDDEKLANKSNAEFKQMKKQLKNVISIQKMRLETALLADRRWDLEAWKKLFVKNPVMHSFAIGLIWCAYEDNKQIQTFRYMEDGTFNTYEEDEYDLPESCTVGLVHSIDLDEETLSAWKEQLSDYEIVQPIDQLERQVYRIKEDEIGKNSLERFKGRKLNDLTLLGRMTKFGWLKGSVQDAGCFSEFYREDIIKRIKNEDGTVNLIGNAVEISFSGMYVSGMGEEVEIEDVRFYNPGEVKRGSYCYDIADNKKSIKLDKINPRYFSEIINQLETILKVSE